MSDLPPDPDETTLAQSLFGKLARATIINLIVFIILAAILGGDALNALRDTEARTLYALKGPGALPAKEVHPAIWVYSLVHGSVSLGLVLVTLILGLLRIGGR